MSQSRRRSAPYLLKCAKKCPYLLGHPLIGPIIWATLYVVLLTLFLYCAFNGRFSGVAYLKNTQKVQHQWDLSVQALEFD